MSLTYFFLENITSPEFNLTTYFILTHFYQDINIFYRFLHKINVDFDFYKMLHKYVFSDIYEWAGQLRSVNMSKKGTNFCPFEKIEENDSFRFIENHVPIYYYNCHCKSLSVDTKKDIEGVEEYFRNNK